MVAEVGFEPTTSGLWGRQADLCSTPRHRYRSHLERYLINSNCLVLSFCLICTILAK